MIGATIKSLLVANAGLTALVPEASIFPYVANEDTALPLIVYMIDSLEPEYEKDGWAGDICNFSVASFSEDYANLQLITKQVRLALDLKKATGILRITATGFNEAYNDGIFGNKLSFQVKVNSYS